MSNINQHVESMLESVVHALKLLPVAKVNAWVFFLCALYLLNMGADLVWRFVPIQAPAALQSQNSRAQSSFARSNASASKQGQQKSDVAAMQAWHLFGEANAVDEVVINDLPNDVDENAKETRLSLKLLGIMQSDNPLNGHAIIEYQSKSDLYAVNQALSVGAGVTLSKVLVDRVIIDNRGSFESLYLWDEKTQSTIKPTRANTSLSRNTPKVVDHRDNQDLTEMAQGYKQQLLNDPMALAEVIRFSPAKDSNGELQGYRIRPGKHRKQFKAFGLKSGDIVKAVNGVELSDPSNALELYKGLRTATEASFDIERGGQVISLVVSLGS